jgi:ACS family hexuronate transporter-like MFS transporter
MAGALGGIGLARLAGVLFDHYKSIGDLPTGYFIMFLICGAAYLLAWLIMHAINRNFE